MNELHTPSLPIPPARAERLSALYDGEHNGGNDVSSDDFCRDVARDDGLAARWASYALIGDVLRSPDLISAPACVSDAFMQRMRASLAAEPVVLVPAAAAAVAAHSAAMPQAASKRPWAWAAGFASITLAAAVAWNALPQRAGDAQLATMNSSNRQNAVVNVAVKPNAASEKITTANNNLSVVQTANGNMIRDARLDQYFSAHHRIGGAATAPAGFVRNAAVQAAACAEC